MLRVIYVLYNTVMFPLLFLRRPVRMGVTALVVNEDGHFLLVRHTYKGGWYFPGGGLEPRETLDAAITRELDEELGLTVTGPLVQYGTFSNLGNRYSDHIVLYLVTDFTMRAHRSPEIAEWGFFTLDALPDGTAPGTIRRLEEYLGHREKSAIW